MRYKHIATRNAISANYRIEFIVRLETPGVLFDLPKVKPLDSVGDNNHHLNKDWAYAMFFETLEDRSFSLICR